MLKLISKLILKLGGFKLYGFIPKEIKKCIIIGAPHTSNWDFVWGRAALYVFNIRVRYLIKDTFFKNKLVGWLFRKTGAIPVDRSKHNNLTDELAKLLQSEGNLYLLFPPEGTRKWVPRWKTGFYRVALETKLPIAIGFIDYKKKQAGFLDMFYPNGNMVTDFEAIEAYYKNIVGKNPENFNPKIFDREHDKN